MKLFGSFVQGGQTQLHTLHMIRQVLWATFKASLVIGILWFCFLIYVVIWDGKTPSPSGEHFSILRDYGIQAWLT
jgi:hypothetical protein